MQVLNKSQALKQLPVLITKSQYEFFSGGKFWKIKQIPLKRKINLIKAGIDNFFPRKTCLSQPTGAMIEPTDICNLHCTGCWANDESHRGRPRYLTVEGFRKVMNDLGDDLCIIWLWCWGEPFLNKNIYEMIRLARSKDIIVISSTNANLPFDSAEIEELLRSGLSQLIVAIDGIDQDTYSTYRIGGKLDLALDNIRSLVEHKKRLGLERPLINMRMLVMYHNQHQIEEFRTLAESLKVDIVSYKTQCDYRKGDDIPLFPSIRKYHRYAIDEESKNILDMKQRYYCNRPWRRIQVFADGAITPCEFDIKREVLLGNIYDGKNINSCWNNTKAANFRRQFLTDIDEIPFCSNCPYKNQVVSDPTVEYYHLTESARS